MDMKLSEKLKCWRAERPDEWTMGEFIRDSIALESKQEDAVELLRQIKDAMKDVEDELRNDKATLNQALIDMSELVQSISEENVRLKDENESMKNSFVKLTTKYRKLGDSGALFIINELKELTKGE